MVSVPFYIRRFLLSIFFIFLMSSDSIGDVILKGVLQCTITDQKALVVRGAGEVEQGNSFENIKGVKILKIGDSLPLEYKYSTQNIDLIGVEFVNFSIKMPYKDDVGLSYEQNKDGSFRRYLIWDDFQIQNEENKRRFKELFKNERYDWKDYQDFLKELAVVINRQNEAYTLPYDLIELIEKGDFGIQRVRMTKDLIIGGDTEYLFKRSFGSDWMGIVTSLSKNIASITQYAISFKCKHITQPKLGQIIKELKKYANKVYKDGEEVK